MWFRFRTPTGRNRRRRTWSVERLEPRQLLAAVQISAAEVETLLRRGAAASASENAIIAVVDRGGHILGVRVEQDVLDAIDAAANGGDASGAIDTADEVATLVYAIDGAVAKARTAAFFANGTSDSRINPETDVDPAGNQPTVGPLTSRTVRFISQSTVTQREVQSNPSITDESSMERGPGFVAPIGIGGHFPPAIAHTPQVDLFGIEHTNRDSIVHPGADRIKGTADDSLLPSRFNVPIGLLAAGIDPPESYGFASGRMLTAQSRGIATLPGGIPLYDGADLVGGIGVFFPGTTDPDEAGPGMIGDATFEQGFVFGTNQTEAQRTNAPNVLEAEWIAFAAAGGSSNAKANVGTITEPAAAGGEVIPDVRFDYPFGRIDLVGISLELIGPKPGIKGVQEILKVGKKVGRGDDDSGANQIVTPGGATVIGGTEVPDGWLVAPRAGSVLTAADVETIIDQGIAAAEKTRAAIRLEVRGSKTVPGARTRMVFAVADTNGDVLGLYRMHDATVFSIDVAVAKARNTVYYASAGIDPADQVDDNNDGVADVPIGTAFTNRTFRFLAEPRYPQGVDGSRQGDFSILNDPGFNVGALKTRNPKNANAAVENLGAPVAASVFSLVTASVVGYDAFHPGTNFRSTTMPIENQNGIVFFPGSAPVYGAGILVGGFGVSGDGVDQDDVVTFFGVEGFRAPNADRADQFKVRGTRLPYQKFNRNPFA